MDAAIKKKWVEALRSGDYKQGTGKLRTRVDIDEPHDKFCCLGVLQEVLDDRRECSSASLPAIEVMQRAGLDTIDPPIQHPTFKHLSSANDGGLTFNEIADIIEAQL